MPSQTWGIALETRRNSFGELINHRTRARADGSSSDSLRPSISLRQRGPKGPLLIETDYRLGILWLLGEFRWVGAQLCRRPTHLDACIGHDMGVMARLAGDVCVLRVHATRSILGPQGAGQMIVAPGRDGRLRLVDAQWRSRQLREPQAGRACTKRNNHPLEL